MDWATQVAQILFYFKVKVWSLRYKNFFFSPEGY